MTGRRREAKQKKTINFSRPVWQQETGQPANGKRGPGKRRFREKKKELAERVAGCLTNLKRL